MPGVGDLRDQPAVVGQHQQPLAVTVEPARDINLRNPDEVGQCRPAVLPVGELGQHVIGLVEQDEAAGACRLPSGFLVWLFPWAGLPRAPLPGLPQMWQEAMPRRSR